MSKKPSKIIGMNYDKFMRLVSEGKEFHMQPARLIPFYKPGDEITLTSIFLSALRLVKEFRTNIFQAIYLAKSGKIYIFTEVEFLYFKKKRIDGLILIVKGKKITNAVFIEVKNKNNEIRKDQIQEYVSIASKYKVPNLLTISNQFVSFPTQSPISIKTPKSVSMYHLSWSYILTVAHILLIENDNIIEDKDQVEIMKEVVDYFESPKSGVVGFTQMKAGWVDVVKKINDGSTLKISDDCVDEAVSSWLEEERDMALILSRELGLLVRSGKAKYKKDLSARVNAEKRELIKNKSLESELQVEGVASNIFVRPNFDRRNVEMSVCLSPPLDKKTRGQLSWINNQIKFCKRKDPKLFATLKSDIMIDIHLKYLSEPIRVKLDEFDSALDKIGVREIRSFNILILRYLGRQFVSRKRFVSIIEQMLIDYYQGVVQYLKKWEKPAPKIHSRTEDQ